MSGLLNRARRRCTSTLASIATILSACSTMPVAHLIPPYDRDAEAAKSIEQRADAQCRARRPDGRAPEPPFKTDGCSGFFDGDWARCCVEHDIAYWCGGGEADRRRADHAFHACLLDGRHDFLATVMYYAVRVGGSPMWSVPWRWGYGWPYPYAYEDPQADAAR